MDVSNHPNTRIAEPYDPAGYRPRIGRDAAEEVMDAVQRAIDQRERDGDWPRLPRSYTITEAAEETGRPRREIYRLIRQRKIEAWMDTYGPALWLIPEEEVEKLMPEASGKENSSGSVEAPSDAPES